MRLSKNVSRARAKTSSCICLRGVNNRRSHPIRDMGTTDDAGYDAIVTTIREAADEGGVYVHCWGGIGRTATVVGCLLVDNGSTGDEALARIDELRAPTRKARMRAPQTDAQEAVVRNRGER